MTDTIAMLHAQMQRAAAADDFEEAARLRDRISLMRGGARAEDVADIDTSAMIRQQPGGMGLGSSRQSVVTPAGWKPPPRPDNLTKPRKRGGR